MSSKPPASSDDLKARLTPLFDQFRSEIKTQPAREVHARITPQVHQILKDTVVAASVEHKIKKAREDTSAPTSNLAINGVNPFPNTLVKPTSVQEVQQIVQGAVQQGKKVRVIGACHSRPKEIICDVTDPNKVVLVSMTAYRGVTIDATKGLAYVKAGTNLGQDPENPDSTLANSLCVQLDKAGYMLPETGGIIHQACGGFLATGSAGGSLTNGFHDVIYSVTIVDGLGNVHTYSRDDADPSNFYATAVCAGLCGIITDIVFTLVPKSDIKGVQITYPVSPVGGNNGCPVNLFGDPGDAPDIYTFLQKPENEYCRMLWYAQPYLPPRVQIWSAYKVPVNSVHKAYVELPVYQQYIAAIALELMWQWSLSGSSELDWLVKELINLFVPVPDMIDFLDTWYTLLPMDNAIVDTLIPTEFTELWVDLQDATNALQAVRKLTTNAPISAGNFFTEIYSAKQSPFWLSPSFSGNKVRLDVNWFQYNHIQGNYTPPYVYADPVPFFQKYWDALDQAGIQYTGHLGKYRPDSHRNVTQLRKDYPKYDAWVQIRQAHDPKQVFLTDYWAAELQIAKI